MLRAKRIAVEVSGALHDPYRHSGVLDGPGWIQQFGADRPNLRPVGMCQQFMKPFRRQGFHIVIEKNQGFTARAFGGQIVHSSEMKGARIGNSQTAQAAQQPVHLRRVPDSMLHDDKFEIRV